MVQVWFIRHGETTWNADGRWQGQTDVPLSEKGKEQALHLANYLNQCHATYPFDCILSSDLSRAIDTASPAAQLLNQPIQSNSLFREEHYGILEGHTASEIQSCPRLHTAWKNRHAGQEDGSNESRVQFYHRVNTALHFLSTTMSSSQRILVFTHGGFIINLFRHIHHYPPAYPVIRQKLCPSIANTSITKLHLSNVLEWNPHQDDTWGLLPHLPSSSSIHHIN